ncbi:MAG: hypothetical protein WA488_28130, partial [Mycobacterium sp.]
ADEAVEFSNRLSAAIAVELHSLRGMPGPDRMATRLRRYRDIGLR